jgi:hypothetical protein
MLATTIHESNTTPHHQAGQQHTNRTLTDPATTNDLTAGGVDCSRFPSRGEEAAGLLSQSPTVCLATPTTEASPKTNHDKGF